MTYDNVKFLSQKTHGTSTAFEIQYDKGKETYKATITLKMNTEVAPQEVEEDIQNSIDANTPVTTMNLIEEYYGVSKDSLMNRLTESRFSPMGAKPIEKKPYEEKNISQSDYYLSALGWELSRNKNISLLHVVLRNKKDGSIQKMVYKYPRGGYDPGLPPYLSLYDVRQDIYRLRDAKQYTQENEYFKKVFKKDPMTGEDLGGNK